MLNGTPEEVIYMIPHPFSPGEIHIVDPATAAPGSVVWNRNHYFMTAAIGVEPAKRQVVLLEPNENHPYAIYPPTIGESLSLIKHGELFLQVIGEAELEHPYGQGFAGRIVITDTGAHLLATTNTHWGLDLMLLSLADGLVFPSDTIRSKKPVFSNWRMGRIVCGQFHPLIERL